MVNPAPCLSVCTRFYNDLHISQCQGANTRGFNDSCDSKPRAMNQFLSHVFDAHNNLSPTLTRVSRASFVSVMTSDFTMSPISILILTSVLTHCGTTGYCTPRRECWPNGADIAKLRSQLEGPLIEPLDSVYSQLSYAMNKKFVRYPGLIALVETTKDVQLCLEFGRAFNIKLTVYSSGHDYARGNSLANDSFQINLSRMRSVKVNVTDARSRTGASVWAQSGATWERVYSEVTKFDKLVVGGTCVDVCVAGFTLGGGVGMLSRSYGLAVDNVIEFDVVLYDGTIARCSHKGTEFRNTHGESRWTKNNDLFWAVRGGGGGTYGVVLSFTFAVHEAPAGFVRYSHSMPLRIHGNKKYTRDTTIFIFNFLRGLSQKWGALIQVMDADEGEHDTLLILILLYNGPWDRTSMTTIRKLRNYREDKLLDSKLQNFSTLEEYNKELQFDDDFSLISISSYIWLNASNEQTVHFFTDDLSLSDLEEMEKSCFMTLIGGSVSDFHLNSAAISSSFRRAHVVASCMIEWIDPDLSNRAMEEMVMLDTKLSAIGKGTYLNEGAVLTGSWRERYWGSHYDRLLRIKRQYDPHNVFTCRHCVGDGDMAAAINS